MRPRRGAAPGSVPGREAAGPVSHAPRYRLDELRRFAAALGVGAGLTPARAAALVTHLLWFDAAGAAGFGIAALPDWLERIDRGEIDPRAEGKLGPEHAGTLVLDGQGGVPPLILARAAGIAIEKARDVGIGIVRVTNLGPAGPAAPTAAEVAIGPEAAAVIGPGPAWSIALPSPAGLPLVVDSVLGGIEGPPPAGLAPWALLAPAGDRLIVTLSVRAIEPLAAFHERIDAAGRSLAEAPGRLAPEAWDARRREVREHGVPVEAGPMAGLLRRAEALGLAPPQPVRAP